MVTLSGKKIALLAIGMAALALTFVGGAVAATAPSGAVMTLATGAGVTTQNASVVTADASKCNATTPIGALAPALPIFCNDLSDGNINATFMNHANAWMDDWAGNTGTVNAALPSAYKTFVTGTDASNVRYFRHNNHWMVDMWLSPIERAYTFMRPDRTFTGDAAENGNLVVETKAAVIDSYGNLGAWPELVLTAGAKGAQPDPVGRNGATYGYEWFPGAYTLGCRMQADDNIICSLMDSSVNGATSGGRVMEIGQWHCPDGAPVADPCSDGSHVFQNGASQLICQGPVDPDATCRNMYRLEVRPDGFTLYVNGVPSVGVSNLGSQYRAGLAALLNGPTYVYNSSDTTELIDPAVKSAGTADIRFHWSHFAVNPEAMGGGAVPPPPPSPTTAPTQPPTATPTSAPAKTATSTPTSAPTRTPATPTAKPATVYQCRKSTDGGKTWTTVWQKSSTGSCQ